MTTSSGCGKYFGGRSPWSIASAMVSFITLTYLVQNSRCSTISSRRWVSRFVVASEEIPLGKGITSQCRLELRVLRGLDRADLSRLIALPDFDRAFCHFQHEILTGARLRLGCLPRPSAWVAGLTLLEARMLRRVFVARHQTLSSIPFETMRPSEAPPLSQATSSNGSPLAP